MAIRYSDVQIDDLMKEKKLCGTKLSAGVELRPKRPHKEAELDLQGANGNRFRLIVRQSEWNPLDFSVILTYCPEKTNRLFRLRRYNGKSHEHTNSIESNSFYDFYVHMATERYQAMGAREDAYAQPSTRFTDLYSAIECMRTECAAEPPKDPQLKLFN